MILFVNACVRSNSRTKRLADRLISKWNEPVSEVLLKNVSFPGTDEAFLIKREQLFYVTTASGDFAPDEYGFGYVKALAQNYYGIQDVQLIKAVGLDLAGADPEQILKNYHFPAITIG